MSLMPAGGAILLSDWLPKVRVECPACGFTRRYDRDEVRARLGDIRMPELLSRLAAAEG
ncbi:hypothetical protein [Aurantimonas sp. VKM B-3413]|uniref:hypothetical protein n=1 Tax=Aurantimonas sp. VKM B-3413 TaxID=2779401 RepID=UPI001E5AF97B|nr:hypothetical protein [Aurantimonas sp. VKM B-3413]MCB8839426.1 hypothetical protein [Aurantimonas sp. VKM B-3413]